MELTITCLIQVGNFYFLYFFLDKILLRPLFFALQENARVQQAVITDHEQKEEIIQTLEHDKREQLIAFQQHLALSYKEPAQQQVVFPDLNDQFIKTKSTVYTEKDLLSAVFERLRNAY